LDQNLRFYFSFTVSGNFIGAGSYRSAAGIKCLIPFNPDRKPEMIPAM
jgi:hypothetical protein